LASGVLSYTTLACILLQAGRARRQSSALSLKPAVGAEL
jgi:hypothetical protein